MILYKDCKIYLAKDKEKKTILTIDVESETPLFDNLTWGGGDMVSVDSSKTVTTTHDFNYTEHNYNIVFPNGCDLKITGASCIQENIGMWKAKNRYKLTLTG